MYALIRPWLFRLEPENAHLMTLHLVRAVGYIPPARYILEKYFAAPPRPVQVFGLNFRNPIGLAAGYDKDGTAWRGLACLGLGHIEIGTVTLKPQMGNPAPRLFRLIEDQALINRMGFPGRGASWVARQLLGYRPDGLVLGVNIGKNKETPLEEAGEEYVDLFRIFAPLADYIAINISSPNTVGLRELQSKRWLEKLLSQVEQARQDFKNIMTGKHIPILVKLAPDLSDLEIDQALEAVVNAKIDGVIATNTSTKRGILRSHHAVETGGLSGQPLFEHSLQMVQYIHKANSNRIPVIAVGGIMDLEAAQMMMDAGACLIQLYTGLIYNGPGLVRDILSGLQ